MAAVEPRGGLFAVPTPIRQLFKLFPLSTLPGEPLPARAPERIRDRPQLYVFAREKDALGSLPSFNPSCLKWQTFLRIAGVDVELVLSNNHASPSGALPFLLPPSTATPTAKAALPVTSDKIGRYARDHSSVNIPHDPPHAEAYSALLTQHIRPAWLHTLYLLPSNLPLLTSLYLPSSALLQFPILQSLRTAATSEILKTTRRSLISPSQLLADAETALQALSTLLAADDWFFGHSDPGLFDAEVFAYTHLILDDTLGWCDDSFARCVTRFDNLVAHRERLYDKFWLEKHQ